MWFFEIAKTLGKEFRSQGRVFRAESAKLHRFGPLKRVVDAKPTALGYWLPRLQVPYPVLWLYSWFDAESRQILDRVNRRVRFDNAKAQRLLGIDFAPPQKSLVEMAYSMIERGIIPKKSGYLGPPAQRTQAEN